MKSVKFESLENPRSLFKKYCKKFSYWNRPLTETEIIGKYSDVSRTLFRDKYFPRMAALNIIFRLEKNQNSLKILSLYGDGWKDMARAYYFLTPKTSMVCIAIEEILGEFGDYLEMKEELRKVFEKLIFYLKRYEILSKRAEALMEDERKKYPEFKEFDYFLPIHKHKTVKGKTKPIDMKEEELKNFNFLNVGLEKSDEKNKKHIQILNKELGALITDLILIRRNGKKGIPLSLKFHELIIEIADGMNLLVSLLNQNLNAGSILDKKIRDMKN